MLRTTRATGSRSTCHAQIHPSKINGDGLQERVVIVFKKFCFRSSTRNQRNNVPEKLHSGILREIAVLTGFSLTACGLESVLTSNRGIVESAALQEPRPDFFVLKCANFCGSLVVVVDVIAKAF